MRLVNELARFLCTFCVVCLYFAPHTAGDGLDKLGSLVFGLPFIVLPLVGIVVWFVTAKSGKHIQIPGFYWATLVVVTVVVSTISAGVTTPRLMSAIRLLLPCLLVPILFQGMVSSRDRRGLRALMISLLAVSLIHVCVQSTVIMPQLNRLYDENPGVVLHEAKLATIKKSERNAKGQLVHEYDISPTAKQDFEARIKTEVVKGSSIYEPTAHFKTSNILAIVMVLFAAFARSIKRNYLCAGALVVAFLMCQSKGVILIFCMLMPLSRKRPNAIRALIVGAVGSMILWQSSVGSAVVDYLKDIPALRSVEFRVSYWMTAKNMDTFGPVGLGQYHELAEKAREPGGHYSTLPHNGFLKLWVELGFVAVAAFIWLGGLLRGPNSRRKEGGAPRWSIFLGATAALVLVCWEGQFNLGEEIIWKSVNGEQQMAVVTRWLPGVMVYNISLLAIFSFLWWRLQNGVWKVGNATMVFAAACLSLHQFIETDLNEPAVLTLFFVLVSIAWLRRPVDNTWSWNAFPILCITLLASFMFITYHPEQDPSYIRKQADIALAENPPNHLKATYQYIRWHEIKPYDSEPVSRLMALTMGEAHVKWAEVLLSQHPSSPDAYFDMALIYKFYGGANKSQINIKLKQAKRKSRKNSLPRYKLSKMKKKLVDELIVLTATTVENEDSLRFVEKMIEAQPSNPSWHLRLAVLYKFADYPDGEVQRHLVLANNIHRQNVERENNEVLSAEELSILYSASKALITVSQN